jgi:predicted Zn-dependent protease
VAEAETLLRTAIDRHPSFAPAYVNLADVYRATGRDGEGERLLQRGLAVVPDDAALAHALGLLHVRQQRYPDAQQQLARAAALAPDNPRYGYVHALALRQAGKAGDSFDVLTRTLARHPNDRDVLYALAAHSLEAGDRTAAARYAERLASCHRTTRGCRNCSRAASGEGRSKYDTLQATACLQLRMLAQGYAPACYHSATWTPKAPASSSRSYRLTI